MRFVNTKTLILLGIIIILLLLIKNIVGSISSLRQNSRIVSDLRQQEQDELQKRDFLRQQLYYSNTQEFVERQAREKLGMIKPGEKIVIVPHPIEDPDVESGIDNTSNWRKWWNILF